MHIIRAFIAKENIIKKLADSWLKESILLSQGFALLFLTQEFFDEIEASANINNTYEHEFEFFTSSVAAVMEEHSVNCKLGYIETEYFGGIGGQGAVFYEDGKMTIAPTWEDGFSGTINRILSELGVKIIGYEDEFESIGLHRFRSMKQVK